ncbi:MAG: SAM-dependent methyltransferase, partial [Eubacterium sp.]
MDNFLKKNERLEDLGIRGLKIIQDPECFCFGIDAVLLAWFA